MSDPIFAVINEAKRLEQIWERLDIEAEAKFFALPDGKRKALLKVPEAERSKAHAAVENAREAWEAALKRVKDAEATTLNGVFARLDYLSACGESDYETMLDVLERIAERQPDLAVT